MESWREYQHEAADVLHQLGFSTKVDDKLPDRSGELQKVDVSASIVLVGVRLLWVVECKSWKRPLPVNSVRTLITLVGDLGADRGLLISESGFQSGVCLNAKGRNITLTSLAGLRANAAIELRLAAAEARLLQVSNRIVRTLRSFGPGVTPVLQALSAGLSSDDWTELASRPDALDLEVGVAELSARSGITTPAGLMPPDFDPAQMRRQWRAGVDEVAMGAVTAEVGNLTQLLNRGKLGDWPLVYVGRRPSKMAFSMRQLLDLVEPFIGELEQQVWDEGKRASGPS